MRASRQRPHRSGRTRGRGLEPPIRAQPRLGTVLSDQGNNHGRAARGFARPHLGSPVRSSFRDGIRTGCRRRTWWGPTRSLERAMTADRPNRSRAGRAQRATGNIDSIYYQFGTAGHAAGSSRRREGVDPRAALHRLAAHLDELVRIVEDVRASRLRQLADARSARRDPAVPGSPEPNRRSPAGPDL
jgi:hypothetical protein